MGLVCNGTLSVMGACLEWELVCNGGLSVRGGRGGSRKPHSKNLHSHFTYVSSTKHTEITLLSHSQYKITFRALNMGSSQKTCRVNGCNKEAHELCSNCNNYFCVNDYEEHRQYCFCLTHYSNSGFLRISFLMYPIEEHNNPQQHFVTTVL
jgi:hypothetical protein